MTDTTALLSVIDPVVEEILALFDIDRPPVPVELMLQRPREDTWPMIDLSEMSATFLNLHDRYAPRMSAVRLLARNIARSPWGQARGLDSVIQDAASIHIFARALVIPAPLLHGIDQSFHDVKAIGLKFEVPESDAEARLSDLGMEVK
jgi:hypothetical protein